MEDNRTAVEVGPGSLQALATGAPPPPTPAAAPPQQAAVPVPAPHLGEGVVIPVVPQQAQPTQHVERGPAAAPPPAQAQPAPAAQQQAALPAEAVFDPDLYEAQLRQATVPYGALREARDKYNAERAWREQAEPELQRLRQIAEQAEQFRGAARELNDDYQRVVADNAAAKAERDYFTAWRGQVEAAEAKRAAGQDVPIPRYDPSEHIQRQVMLTLAQRLDSLESSIPRQLQSVLVNHDAASLQRATAAQNEWHARRREADFREQLKAATADYPLFALDESVFIEQARQQGFNVDAKKLVNDRKAAFAQYMGLAADRNATLARQMAPSVGAGGAAPAPNKTEATARATADAVARWRHGG